MKSERKFTYISRPSYIMEILPWSVANVIDRADVPFHQCIAVDSIFNYNMKSKNKGLS